ncbi:Hypothetical protein AJAP_08045 [Amycolatopsis japonica]|uniref:Uncharacterized protein n=1 Tax=Amycolatopsis japonica TaxID=208439 RepID=A0A075UNQ8_9PSEU|nr:Hypothetical protein AJAP_08045 [Amycolatopsis japonica]
MRGRHRLQPDGLPDTRRGGAEDPFRVVPLLADGMRRGVGPIRHADGEFLRSRRTQDVGDVGAEGRVPAFVDGHLLVVDPHRRGLVDGAEVEQHPLTVPTGRNVENLAIPEGFVPPSDAGERRFRRARHQDPLAVPVAAGRAAARVLPDAVEVQPAFADQPGRGYSGSALPGPTCADHGVESTGSTVSQAGPAAFTEDVIDPMVAKIAAPRRPRSVSPVGVIAPSRRRPTHE